MRTEAKFAEVLESVRAHVTGYPHMIEGDWQLCRQIANNLNIKLQSSIHPWENLTTEEKLMGQVRRALNKLAEAGTLVKVSDGHRVEFSTPETHARHQREHAEREAEQQAVDKRTRNLRDRIRALGITGTNTDNYGRITLELDMAERLTRMAEGHAEVTRHGTTERDN
jgi:hypothetical protein